MRLTFCLLLFLSTSLNSSVGFAQDLYEEFRALEDRVRYSDPAQLDSFSKSIDTSKLLGKAIHHWARGRAFYWESNYPKAYTQLDKAKHHIEELNNKPMLAELYLDLSSSLAVVDKNGRALSFLLEANQILESSGDREQQTRAAISLGEMYRKMSEHEEAMKVLRTTLKKTDSLLYNKARCFNRMAAVFSETGKYDSSEVYSYRALELAQAIGDVDLIATSENEIGYILRQQNKFEESLEHFFLADSLWRSVGMLRYATNPMHHVAVVYRSMHQFEKGLTFTRHAYSLVKGKGWYQIEMNLLDDLRMYHYHFDNQDSVLFYDRERLEATIYFRSEQYEVNTKMVEVLFAQKANEQIIREQEVKLRNEALEKEAINRERTTLWVIVSLVLIILLIIFIYANTQRKLQKKLAQENRAKESKNAQLQGALEANESLVQEISHRVKNNLAVLAGLLNMQANRSDSEKVKKELKDSVLRIESIATIHKKLYDKRSDARVNLKDALEELSENVVAAMGKDPTSSLNTKIDTIEVDIARAVTLCLIINEAITNSCKYAPVSEESQLMVTLDDQGEKFQCKVIDHGSGFEVDELVTQSRSLGLYLIKLLAKQLNAKINWYKEKERFIFSIELTKDE